MANLKGSKTEGNLKAALPVKAGQRRYLYFAQRPTRRLRDVASSARPPKARQTRALTISIPR
jgi:hypothetical protein